MKPMRHSSAHHSHEGRAVHTNGMENFWSLLKRGLGGTYIAVELDRLNTAYEARHGFRYCVFVASRSQPRLCLEAAALVDRPTLKAAVLVLGLEHAVDFGDQVFEVERLGQQLRLRRRAPALQRDRGTQGIAR